MLDNFGTLTTRAYTAGALPVEGAVVRILGAEEGNRGVAFSLITDMDGIATAVQLPAPSPELSLLSDGAEPPYSLYNFEITADGFYPKRIFGVTVFPGINSVMEVNMIPYGVKLNGNYPRGNVNAIIPSTFENE